MKLRQMVWLSAFLLKKNIGLDETVITGANHDEIFFNIPDTLTDTEKKELEVNTGIFWSDEYACYLKFV